jgi:ubiquinone/menaquinone biosynthesis C-methylase UbiE
VAAAEASPFADRAVDACFMGMVLHETADSNRALLEARRVARNLVAVLEWPPPMPTDPPPPARRFDYEEIDRMGRRTDFRWIAFHRLTDMVLYRMTV